MKMKSAGVVDGGLFTESYCNICNAQLISESQRTAHYEVRLDLLSFGSFFYYYLNSHSQTLYTEKKCWFQYCFYMQIHALYLALFVSIYACAVQDSTHPLYIDFQQHGNASHLHTSTHIHTHLLLVYLSADLQGCIMNDH